MTLSDKQRKYILYAVLAIIAYFIIREIIAIIQGKAEARQTVKDLFIYPI